MTSKGSARKAARVAERRKKRNKPIRSAAKTYVSRADKLIQSGDFDAARLAVIEAQKALDKAAQKGVIHPNNAARRKSRLMRRLNKAFLSSKQG